MSRGWYNPRPYGGPRPPWRPRPMGQAPPRGYWSQGPMSSGYPPRPQWDSNYLGAPPANYQGQYRPQYYQAKRPRYDQFQSYPKRPRYQNNSDNSYDDLFYDKFMLEDPWKDLLPHKNPIDTSNDSRCEIEPGVSSEDALAHTSESGSPLQVSFANPPSPEGCQSIAALTSESIAALTSVSDGETESKEYPLSSTCDGSPVVGKPSDIAECSEQMVLEPLNVIEPSSTDEHLTPSGAHSSIVDQQQPVDGAICEVEALPTIDGSHSAVVSDGFIDSTLPSDQL